MGFLGDAFGFLKDAFVQPYKSTLDLARGDIRGAVGNQLGGQLKRGVVAGSVLGGGALGGALGGAAGGAGSAAGSGGITGVLGGVGNFIKSNPDLILGGLGVLNDARQGQRADEIQDRGLDIANMNANRHIAMQDQLVNQLGNLRFQPTDLSSHFEDPSNPFYRPRSSVSPVSPQVLPPAGAPPVRRGGGPGIPGVGGGRIQGVGVGRPPLDDRLI